MEVIVQGRNINISDKLNDFVIGKASKLEKYLQGIDETRVDLAHVKTARSASDRYVAQITVRGKKILLRSEERADDIRVCFDSALNKMQRQIRRYKGKRYRGRGDGRTISEIASDDLVDLVQADEIEEEEAPVIVRRKTFVLTPMDEMEAIEQMQLLGHEEFFVFYNAENGKVNVLYQRRDGTYGLIIPENG